MLRRFFIWDLNYTPQPSLEIVLSSATKDHFITLVAEF